MESAERFGDILTRVEAEEDIVVISPEFQGITIDEDDHDAAPLRNSSLSKLQCTRY